MDDVASPERDPSLRQLARTFGWIGLVSFGGPAGQIALMHRLLVDEKRWLDERRFLHALNYCMLLPGPEAMQLATYAGWLTHGVRGGLIAGLLFLLPGALLITALAALYVSFGHLPAVAGVLFGLKAAVLAVVLEALMRVSKRALKNGVMLAMALASFVAIALFQVPFPIVIAVAALAGALFPALFSLNSGPAPKEAPIGGIRQPAWARPSSGRFFATLFVWLAIWLIPLAGLILALGWTHVLTVQAIFFSKMATVTFGGAYAVLSYVAQQAVEVHGWLQPDEMLTGLGLAETLPGPLILVLVFVGFLGGSRLGGFDPLLGGAAAAVVTLWFTFVPCFLWIFVGAPYVEAVRHVRWLNTALAAVTSAVVGVIANLAAWFAIHVLFGQVGSLSLGWMAFPRPDPASLDIWAAVIATSAAVALLRYHANIVLVLAASAVVGAALKLV